MSLTYTGVLPRHEEVATSKTCSRCGQPEIKEDYSLSVSVTYCPRCIQQVRVGRNGNSISYSYSKTED